MLAWSSLLLLLLPPGLTAMTCDSDGVLCVAYPLDCTSDCDYLLKYKAASTDTTQIEVSGKPDSHSLSTSTSSNMWLAFGFSGTGTMYRLTVYACQKYNNVYTVRKRYSPLIHFLGPQTEDVASETIVGSLVDGVMTCKYTIDNSKLPSGDMKMAYGMGRLSGDDGMSQHSQTPRTTSNYFSIIQQYSGFGGEMQEINTPVLANYVRVRAVKKQLICAEGKKRCSLVFTAKRARGAINKKAINKQHLKICKVAKNGGLIGCKPVKRSQSQGNVYFRGVGLGGKARSGHAGQYVCVHTEDGVETRSDPVTLTVSVDARRA